MWIHHAVEKVSFTLQDSGHATLFSAAFQKQNDPSYTVSCGTPNVWNLLCETNEQGSGHVGLGLQP